MLPPYKVIRLRAADTALMEAMMTTFGEVFDDLPTYTGARPREGYMSRLLGDENFVALAAVMDGGVVGGLAAYNLQKFERERSEVYIYDLAVWQLTAGRASLRPSSAS